ncbi:prion-inhibition and propagation-domain-containing protein [Hypomontagnella submonticulosa]|nr:prion-inhibition and propagation-domain-containing protein [Hypomontagnella submonticulosa]
MDVVSSTCSLLYVIIDCFNRIQLAREFEDDFAAYQLKLDILQMRLSRWGEVAKTSNADLIKEAAVILSKIEDTLGAAQRKATKTKATLAASNKETLDPESNVPNHLKKIRMVFRQCLHKRTAQAGKVVASMKWAFYQKAQFDKFIADMSALVKDLEDLFPEDLQQKLRELSNEECGTFSKPNLEELMEFAEGCDPWLESAVDERLRNLAGAGTYITQSHNTGMVTGIHHGDVNGVSNGNNNKTRNYWGRR